VNPEIKRYLDEHGATYTPEALRKGLLDAGYDATAVDAALHDWAATRTGPHAGPDNRRTFGRWALRLHLAALVATFLLLALLKGTQGIGVALIGVGVLAVALLLGWAISSLIGRALLPRAGVTIALIVPAISALLLGGACFAIMNAAIAAPPHDGTVNLKIVAPFAFEGSGGAACYLDRGGYVQVLSYDLGTLDGRSVRASIDVFGTTPGEVKPAGEGLLTISLNSTASDETQVWSSSAGAQLTFDTSSGGGSGTIHYEGLPADATQPGAAQRPPISGSISWTCK
jgi:hypothetical protein